MGKKSNSHQVELTITHYTAREILDQVASINDEHLHQSEWKSTDEIYFRELELFAITSAAREIRRRSYVCEDKGPTLTVKLSRPQIAALRHNLVETPLLNSFIAESLRIHSWLPENSKNTVSR